MEAAMSSRARNFENFWPISVGALAALLCWSCAPTFFEIGAENEWAVGAVYSLAFDISSIFTAFLFTFYSFVLNAENGFVGKMKRTLAYKQTISFTVTALWLGTSVIVTSIPMVVISPTPSGGLWLVLVSAWFGLVIWSAGAFGRAAYLFSIFAGQRPD